MASHLLPSILKAEPRSRIPVCWLIRAAKTGNMAMLTHMLDVKQAFVRNEHHLAVCQAAKYNQPDCLRVLLDDPLGRFDPSWAKNDALACAAMEGNMACLQLLLNDPRVAPYDCDNRALAYAADAGHEPVVDALLMYSGVDPYALSSRAIRWAAANGHLPVLRKLLAVR